MAKIVLTSQKPRRFKAPLSEQHLIALGHLSAEYSLMCAVAEMAVWHLRGDTPEEGRQTTGPKMFEGRMQLLVEAAKAFPFNLLQRKFLAAYVSAMRTAASERGALMHGVWLKGTAVGAVKSVVARRGIGKRIGLVAKDYKPEAIMELADRMSELSHEFVNFLEQNAERPAA